MRIAFLKDGSFEGNLKEESMERPGFIVSTADFFFVFVYGGMMSYAHHFYHPLPEYAMLISSGALAFILGSFGPDLDEMIEWLLTFSLGVLVALLSPQIVHFYNTGVYDINAISETVKASIPFLFLLLKTWVYTFPVCFVFAKLTKRNYYRHARFF